MRSSASVACSVTAAIARREAQEISDLRLRAFDPGTEDALEADVGCDEDVGVREQSADIG